jgi:hypothetical protein
MKIRDLTLERRPHIFSPLGQQRMAVLLNNVVAHLTAKRMAERLELMREQARDNGDEPNW